jgi:hypothetical protein
MKKPSEKYCVLLVLVMMVLLPVVIHHFHNHEADTAEHPDCPVTHWESTFIATFVLAFALVVVSSPRRFVPPPLRETVLQTTHRGVHYRAPPSRTV